jgi:hypothetical protein
MWLKRCNVILWSRWHVYLPRCFRVLVNKWSVVCVDGRKLIMEFIIIYWLQQLKLCLWHCWVCDIVLSVWSRLSGHGPEDFLKWLIDLKNTVWSLTPFIFLWVIFFRKTWSTRNSARTTKQFDCPARNSSHFSVPCAQ